MIHQFIFAVPKPGLTAAAFQSYWINFHAVEYASRIPQILKYLVAVRTTSPVPRPLPHFEGVAEIWLANEETQLASLQSPEFLQGARVDEPRWAAFWLTQVLDTDSTQLCRLPAEGQVPNLVKMYVLCKRRPGVELTEFRGKLRNEHAHIAMELPELQTYTIATARDGLYELGEPRFDAIEIYGFADAGALARAWQRTGPLEESWKNLTADRYRFNFPASENWIIRPDQR